jgi:hypothetical protein
MQCLSFPRSGFRTVFGKVMTLENRHVGIQEQRLYNHLLMAVQTETPEQLLARVRQLFVEGLGYNDGEVVADLEAIVGADDADEQFRFVLNRCIHILTNRWQGRPHSQQAIPALINLIDTAPQMPIANYSRSRAVKRQRELIYQFRTTDQYVALKRLATLMAQSADQSQEQKPLGHLIRRYPYLYTHCLIPDGADHEDKLSVRSLQETAQFKFEVDLSRYVTYQVRKSALLSSRSEDTVGRILNPVRNPTLLTEAEVCESLRYFVGKVDGRSTHRDLARHFVLQSQDTGTFKQFKDDFYTYLVEAIDPEYGRRQFNNQLYQQLQSTLPDQNNQPVNELMVMRLAGQLLNFLIVESAQQPKHFVFIDMISNLGPMLTTSVLLKLILVCRKVKPYLEKRLSILFNHYESYTQSSVEWLVMLMENLNLAFSSNFGQLDVAFIDRL